jgi:hypothetical protein
MDGRNPERDGRGHRDPFEVLFILPWTFGRGGEERVQNESVIGDGTGRRLDDVGVDFDAAVVEGAAEPVPA